MSEDRKKELRCSFCGKSEHEVHRMIQGPGVRICDECVRLCMDVLEDGYEPHDELEAPDSIPTPREIREVLDQYIIGQEAAKVALSVSVYNHYKRIFFGGDDEVELQKSNILLLGPTGSGKTLFAQTLARILKVPFAIADATTHTLLFLSGGAFEGIEKIIESRLDRKSMGFGAELKSKNDVDESKILREVQPHDILKFGIIPELVGRLPVITALDALTRDDLVKILTQPKNALVKQYQKLFSYDDAELTFEPKALEAIADKAIERKIGGRGLRGGLAGVVMHVMYDIPSDRTIDRVTITPGCVEGTEQPKISHRTEKEGEAPQPSLPADSAS